MLRIAASDRAIQKNLTSHIVGDLVARDVQRASWVVEHKYNFSESRWTKVHYSLHGDTVLASNDVSRSSSGSALLLMLLVMTTMAFGYV